MKYILTGKQMQYADKHTIETIGIPSMVLMERAALGVVETMEIEGLDFTNVLVVCGPGNNGGDGYAVARILHLKGYRVSLYFVGNETKRTNENLQQYKITQYYQIPVKQKLEEETYTIIIDAIFGTGLSRTIEGEYKQVLEQLNKMAGTKVAIDIPTGLHDETGNVFGVAFKADITVALAYAKLGHVLQAGNPYIGKLSIVDIGIGNEALPTKEKLIYHYEFEDFRQGYPKRLANSHKGTYGKVLLVVGSCGMSGAALLCARAAYAVGAGLVQIYTPEENREILQKLLPEAMVTAYIEYDESQLEKLLGWADVVGIGCGIGVSEMAWKITKYVIRNAKAPCVVDADGLNLIAADMQRLKEATQPIIITPHMKEMTRLLGCEIGELKEHKLEMLKRFCDEYAITCVLKDARTLVGCSEKDWFLNLTGNSALSKGGTGDVLCGIITGILAQKKDLYASACLGVYLHGLTGEFVAKKKGQYSVLASDIVENIDEILRQI